jgi:hypothetical protein
VILILVEISDVVPETSEKNADLDSPAGNEVVEAD